MIVIRITTFVSLRVAATNPAAKRIESPGIKKARRTPVSIKTIAPIKI
jgi:hypothetical protein